MKVLGTFEKDLSNDRIGVFFGQEQEGARHSTFISTKDREEGVKKIKKYCWRCKKQNTAQVMQRTIFLVKPLSSRNGRLHG